MEFNTENYYSFGTDPLRPVISNSSLNHINPHQGGSFKRFEIYMGSDADQKTSLSLERGKLIHKFLESPEEFAELMEDGLPGKTVKAVIDRLHEIIPQGVSLEDSQPKIIEVAKELDFGGINKVKGGWSEVTVINKIIENTHYFKHLRNSQTKIMVSSATKEIIEKMSESLKKAFWNIIDSPNAKKEVALMGEYEVIPGVKIPIKGLLDYLNGSQYIDLKSSSTPISKFFGYKIVNLELLDRKTIPNGHRLAAGPFHTYRIYRQLAFYRKLYKQNFEGDFKANLMICENIEPFEVRFQAISDMWLDYGDVEIDMCMKQVYDYLLKKNALEII